MTKYLWQQTKQMDTTQPIGDPADSLSKEAVNAYPALDPNASLADYNGKVGFAGGGFSAEKPGDPFDQLAQMQTTQEVGDKDRQSAEAERAYKEFSDLT